MANAAATTRKREARDRVKKESFSKPDARYNFYPFGSSKHSLRPVYTHTGQHALEPLITPHSDAAVEMMSDDALAPMI